MSEGESVNTSEISKERTSKLDLAREKMLGFRKILILTEGLCAFAWMVLAMKLTDAAAILAVGTTIIGLVSAAIYGNVKEHQITNTTPIQVP